MKARRGERRTDALSKDRIVEVAIAILDAEGESALTFRTLAARLATGAGAIYWHVADKTALLTAATGDLIDRALAEGDDAPPRQAVRALALRVFDLIDAHSWVGGHLAREPWQPAMLRIFEGVGRQIQALGVPESTQFNAATALVNYILGCAGQNAANARLMPPGTDRDAALAAFAAEWTKLDPAEHPFVRKMAARLGDHDDREQFLAGVDLILAGLEAGR
ncbi:MAG: TetR/AcrR family transcriptional regulator C-terminal domain-containing protein [Caulobacter sp.]|nr:TetR/AcrR family transcriptional regulator C-terminal domain-containing protein [Caulobacter sp.]